MGIKDFPVESPATLEAAHAEIAELRSRLEQFERVEQERAERYRSFIAQTTDAVWCFEYDEPIPTTLPIEEQVQMMVNATLVECNDVCAKAYGYENASQAEGTRFEDLVTLEEESFLEGLRDYVRNDYRGKEVVNVQELPDGSRRYLRNNAQGIVEEGRLVRVWGTFRDVTDTVLAEQTVRRTAQQLADAQSVASVGSWIWEPATGEVEWSVELHNIFGIDRERPPTVELFDSLVHPEDLERIQEIRRAHMEHEAPPPLFLQHRIIRPDGQVRVISTRSRQLDSGTMIGTVQDVTSGVAELNHVKSSLEEKETLLREIHHRIKNNMELVSSLLYLQSRSTEKNPQAVLQDARDRILAIAQVHAFLYRSEGLSHICARKHLGELIDSLRNTHREAAERIAFEVEIDEIRLDASQAVLLGLLVNELTNNALKHGFPRGVSGSLSISCRRQGNRAHLTVRDSGAGCPGFVLRECDSIGMRLVSALVAQLGGRIDIASEVGFRVEVDFPHWGEP
ncbi:MAG: PAS domain-containing protein [Myxococcales bacterium]|nr:PAS domain-containing protein [Myxococcales bacterium]